MCLLNSYYLLESVTGNLVKLKKKFIDCSYSKNERFIWLKLTVDCPIKRQKRQKTRHLKLRQVFLFVSPTDKHYTCILKTQTSVHSTVGGNLKSYTIEKWFLCNFSCCIYYLSQCMLIINTSFLKIYSKFLLNQQSHFLRVWVSFVACLLLYRKNHQTYS